MATKTEAATAASAIEDDDPVVCEIPVHLAENLRKSLYMVQFPLRPAYRPMPAAPRHARIKPDHQILQLDYDVDHKSEHFDRDAEDYLKQKHLRLQSSCVPALSNYALGVVRDGQLHLTPVTAVLQMRPSLAHIDEAIDDVVEDMDVTDEQEQKQEQDDSAAMKEVQFQFKKKQSERAITAIQNSYAYKKQQINAETWRELQVHDKESGGAETEFENLFSEREEDVISTMSANEYLKALRYRTNATPVTATSAPSSGAGTKGDGVDAEDNDEQRSPLSRVDPQHLEILQRLMTDHVLHFADLQSLLPKRSEEELVTALKTVALCIRGRLLPKSVYVCANASSVKAREALLEELSAAPTGISRAEVAEQRGIDAELAKDLLEKFAVLDRSTRLWAFKVAHDDTFPKRFPVAAKAMRL